MIDIGKEYYFKPYYFYIKDNNEYNTLYFSSNPVLSEARTNDEKVDFKKNEFKKFKSKIKNMISRKKKMTTDQMKDYFQDTIKNNKKNRRKKTDVFLSDGEMNELIDYDGTFKRSKIPIYNRRNTSKKTTDQTVYTTVQTVNPLTRGYRTYWASESVDDKDTLKEVNYSDSYGWEDTENMDGEETYKTLIKKLGLEPDDAKNRTKEFGKDPKNKRQKNTPKKIKKKKGFVDTMVLSELQRNRVLKMVEDILATKNDDCEITEKEKEVSKILKNNISVLKKMAKKEGITLTKLIQLIKK